MTLRTGTWIFLACGLAFAPRPILAFPEGVQNFLEEAPPDIFTGPLVIYGQVVHRATDGSWIRYSVQSHWGTFIYVVSLFGTEGSPVPRLPGTPEMPLGAVEGRVTPWNRLEAGSSRSWLWLEGVITNVRPGGTQMEGRFALGGAALRLRFTLAESNPLGADPVPTFRNVYYGANVRQKLDVYLAKGPAPTPAAIYIHGGSWQRGDKTSLTGQRRLLDAGISVVAIDYRYIPRANPSSALPAVAIPLGDAARALQFVRSKAAEWGLAKDRIGVWGISAGACSALWLATHRDLADPASGDPVLRESTKPACVAGIFAQTSLDPAEIRAWVGPEAAYGAHAFGIAPGAARTAQFAAFLRARDQLLPWIKAYSPAALLTSDAVPIFLDYREFSLTPCESLDSYYTHSPRYGLGFLDLARRAGTECHLRYEGREDASYRDWEQFLIGKLTNGASGPDRRTGGPAMIVPDPASAGQRS